MSRVLVSAVLANDCPFCQHGRRLHGHTTPDGCWIACNACGAKGPVSQSFQLALVAWDSGVERKPNFNLLVWLVVVALGVAGSWQLGQLIAWVLLR